MASLLLASPSVAAVAGFSLAMIAALLDASTGPDVWLGPIYLVAVCIVTWGMGWRVAVALGIFCAVLTSVINGGANVASGSMVWNLSMRVVSVAMMIALLAAVRRSFEEEQARARCDGLTGLLNRRAFFEDAGRLMRNRREWRLLAFVDFDGFKQLNDRHGHTAGDAALRRFAQELSGRVRRGDLFARAGGDEFLLLIRAQNECEARAAAIELYARMNKVLEETASFVSCSFGALVLPPQVKALHEQHVALADGLMYSAKSDGSGLRVELLDGSIHKDMRPAAPAPERLRGSAPARSRLAA